MEKKYCITLDDVYSAKERIKDHIIHTPLMHYDNLAALCGCNLHLKLETMQRCKAFKFRGALNKILTIPTGSTCVAVSAGNHSQGVALASSLTGNKSIIYMPETAPSAKVQATQHYGGKVIKIGKTFDEAKTEMLKALEQNPELIFVPPYNDPYIIAGTGTIGLEILEDLSNVDTVVVPIGGGGLISGIAYTLKQLKPSIIIIGVNMASCPSTYKLFHEKKGVTHSIKCTETITPLADGIAVKSPGELNLEIIYDLVDDIVVVNEDEVALSVALLAERGKLITEGAGATTFAAVYNHKFSFKSNENIVCIVSGGNIQLRMLARCIDRALFLRKIRISANVVLPYGTIHLANLIQLLADKHVEVVSCLSAPHVDTPANKEQYHLIFDIETHDDIDLLTKECLFRGWDLVIRESTENLGA